MIQVFESHKELMEALLSGKRIKQYRWDDNSHIKLGDDMVVDEELADYEFDFNRPNDWTLA